MSLSSVTLWCLDELGELVVLDDFCELDNSCDINRIDTVLATKGDSCKINQPSRKHNSSSPSSSVLSVTKNPDDNISATKRKNVFLDLFGFEWISGYTSGTLIINVKFFL